MTSRAVPRSRVGVIRLSDQPWRDARTVAARLQQVIVDAGEAFRIGMQLVSPAEEREDRP